MSETLIVTGPNFQQVPATTILIENLSVAFLAYFNSLPTDVPAEPGIAWNNGGVLQVS